MVQYRKHPQAAVDGIGDNFLWEFLDLVGHDRNWSYDLRVRKHDKVVGYLFRSKEDGGLLIACPKLEVSSKQGGQIKVLLSYGIII